MKHKDLMKQLKKNIDKYGDLVRRVSELEENLANLNDRVGDDLSVIIRTVADLQDRFETETGVNVGGPLPTHDEAADAFRAGHAAGVHDYEHYEFHPIISVEPSNITGSPHKYLYIYLTSDLADGPHIIVSDAEEFQDNPGIAVGGFEHYEGEEGNSVVVHTAEEMIVKIQELMDGTS